MPGAVCDKDILGSRIEHWIIENRRGGGYGDRPASGRYLGRYSVEYASNLVQDAAIISHVTYVSGIVHKQRRLGYARPAVERHSLVDGVVSRSRNDRSGNGSTVVSRSPNRKHMDDSIDPGYPRDLCTVE